MKAKTETEQDDKEFERFDNLLRKVVNIPKKSLPAKKGAGRAENNDPLYIVIDDKMLIYRLNRINKAANSAYLTLYKNLSDFHSDDPLKAIEVVEWQ